MQEAGVEIPWPSVCLHKRCLCVLARGRFLVIQAWNKILKFNKTRCFGCCQEPRLQFTENPCRVGSLCHWCTCDL